MNLRPYQSKDINAIVALFYNTVHCTCANDYTPAQLQAWAPSTVEADLWNLRFLSSYTLVAEIKEEIVGFANLLPKGHLDMLYIHKNYQRQGVAGSSLVALENYAKERKLSIITSDVSITARPFFEKYGYLVLKEQNVHRSGILLTNFRMSKQLP